MFWYLLLRLCCLFQTMLFPASTCHSHQCERGSLMRHSSCSCDSLSGTTGFSRLLPAISPSEQLVNSNNLTVGKHLNSSMTFWYIFNCSKKLNFSVPSLLSRELPFIKHKMFEANCYDFVDLLTLIWDFQRLRISESSISEYVRRTMASITNAKHQVELWIIVVK